MTSQKRKNKKINLLKDQMFLTKKYVDMKDPIYDSEVEDENCFYTVLNAEEIEYSQKISNMKNKMFDDLSIISFEEFEKKSESLINSFFFNFKFEQFIGDLKDLNVKKYNDYLVLQLLKKSFDRDNETHIAVSCLLNLLNITKLIIPEQVHRAFEKILLSLDDIKLDCPECYEIVLKYLRFCTLDNVIDKDFIFKLPSAFFDTLEINKWDEKEIGLYNNNVKENELNNYNIEEINTNRMEDNQYNDAKNVDMVDNILNDSTKENSVSSRRMYNVANTTSDNNIVDEVDENDENNEYTEEEKKKMKKEAIWKNTMLWVLKLNLVEAEKEKKEFKKKTRDFLIDFFNDGNTDEVIEFLNQTNSLYHYEFIRISIIESFSKNNLCRKYVSFLLDELCGSYFFESDIVIAFIRIIGYIDDYEIDFPNCKEMLCKFLHRCIYDDILCPAFLNDMYRLHIGGVTGMMISNKTQQRINDKKTLNMNNIDHIWDDDDTYAQMKLKRKINNTLLEYFYSYISEEDTFLDLDEFLPANHDLYNYVVKKIFVLNVDINNDTLQSLKLVEFLINKKFITLKNVEGGLIEVMHALKDIILDIPKYPTHLKNIITQLLNKKYITQDVFDTVSKGIDTCIN
ncbi:conserved protein, unknown function [Hepatocystis sp. ex Piliocolobus tephrosceles]|nr:conserved protein, unknown function [Hepatocystis sp. ex Piliocolobus tephrosceles]